MRRRIFLRSVIPLLPIILAERRALRILFFRTTAAIDLHVGSEASTLRFERGSLSVVPGAHPAPDLRLRFDDIDSTPRVEGALRHPLLAARVLALLAKLRILNPDQSLRRPADRALRVKLVLYMVTHALSQLNRGGHPEMAALASESPDRVYQWTIEESGVAAYLRMRAGRTKAGRGAYRGRRPFVHFVFPTVDGAFRCFTTTASQMEAVERGWVRTDGSPEYARKVSRLMQQVDELLTAG